MNVKRFLKKQARKDQQAILEADGGKTLRALGIDYHAPKQKNRMLPSILGIAGAAASIVIIVCIVAFYPQKIDYIDANFESRESTLTEMSSEIHDFTFEIDESFFSAQITRTSDNVSNDVLYYTVFLNSYDSLITMELVAVCNPKFEYTNFEFSKTPIEKSLTSYNILYDFGTKPDPQFGLDSLFGKAEIDGENDIVYVRNYKELLVQPEPVFFDLIQTIVKPVQ